MVHWGCTCSFYGSGRASNSTSFQSLVTQQANCSTSLWFPWHEVARSIAGWDASPTHGTPSILSGCPDNSLVPIYSLVDRGTVRVKCLAQEHNTMTHPDLSWLECSALTIMPLCLSWGPVGKIFGSRLWCIDRVQWCMQNDKSQNFPVQPDLTHSINILSYHHFIHTCISGVFLVRSRN